MESWNRSGREGEWLAPGCLGSQARTPGTTPGPAPGKVAAIGRTARRRTTSIILRNIVPLSSRNTMCRPSLEIIFSRHILSHSQRPRGNTEQRVSLQWTRPAPPFLSVPHAQQGAMASNVATALDDFENDIQMVHDVRACLYPHSPLSFLRIPAPTTVCAAAALQTYADRYPGAPSFSRARRASTMREGP